MLFFEVCSQNSIALSCSSSHSSIFSRRRTPQRPVPKATYEQVQSIFHSYPLCGKHISLGSTIHKWSLKFFQQSDHPSKCTPFPPWFIQTDWVINNFLSQKDTSCKFGRIPSRSNQHIQWINYFSCTKVKDCWHERLSTLCFHIYFFICVCKRFRRRFTTLCRGPVKFVNLMALRILISPVFSHIKFQRFHKFGQCWNTLISWCFDSSSWFCFLRW